MNDKKLTLKDVKVLFFHKDDAKFGSSITIDATETEIQRAINNWASDNNIKMTIKDYTDKEGKTTKQATFKLAKFVEIKDADLNETTRGLNFGAIVSLIASAYDYKNNFGEGTTASVTKIKIKTPAVTKSDEEFQDL